MKNYSLNIPNEVICGEGAIDSLLDILIKKGSKKIVFFIDRGVVSNNIIEDLLNDVNTRFDSVTVCTDVPPEPSKYDVLGIYEKLAENEKPDTVVAIGGGSVMDTSKIVSVMLNNPEYCKNITDNSLIKNRGVAFIAVPTSAGTGAEATPNAIVLIPEQSVKFGIVHRYFLPCSVILEPRLTVSMPQKVTASTGIDAFCHCIETYISKKATPFTEMFALKGIEFIEKYLRRAFDNKNDMEAREGMLLAAFYGGVAICTSSTVAVHALSYPLGGTYHIPHGVSNAILLAPVMEYTLPSIGEKVVPIAQAMGIPTAGKTEREVCAQVVAEIKGLVRYVGIPEKLTDFGITAENIDSMAQAASEVHRLIDNNPKPLGLEDIKKLYLKLM